MKTPLKLVLLLVVGVAVLGMGWTFLSSDRSPERVPGGARPDSPATEAPTPPIPTDTAPEDGPRRPDLPDLNKTVDAFLKNVKVKPFPRPKEVLAKARQGELGPIDYRLELEKSLRHEGGPSEGAGMLIGMKDDSDVLRFQTALGLSKRLDDASTQLLLEALPGADAAVRPHIVFALRGSAKEEVNQAFVQLYTGDRDLAVRAQAAFVIGERGERLPPLLLERARQTARDDIRADDGTRMKAGMDVLGAPPLSAEDRRMLEGILASDPNSQRRLAALQALATAKVPPAELEPLLARVADDPSASEQLRAAVNAVLNALRTPAPPPDESE